MASWPGRTALEQLSLSQKQSEVRPGDYWCSTIDGEDWPVVICDEEIVQRFFEGTRPATARQPSGLWERVSTASKSYPALIPGTLKLWWPTFKTLENFDRDMGEAIRRSTSNLSLAKAWGKALRCEGEGKDIGHWKAELAANRGTRVQAINKVNDLANDSCRAEGFGKKQEEIHKRKRTSPIKFPSGYSKMDWDDDEGENLLTPPADSAVPKIKNEFGDSTSSAEIDALYEDSDTPRSGLSDLNKRKKLDFFGRFSNTPIGNRVGSSRPVTPAMSSQSGLTSPLTHSSALSSSKDKDKIIVYVGNPHKKFRVRRSGLEASPLLSSLATYHPKDGWYLMSPLLSSMSAPDFLPVGQYLERGEYTPNILDEGTEWVRLEDDTNNQRPGEEVVRCGKIYSFAQILELPGLQDLAFRKLKALAKQERYQPLAILSVIKRLFSTGDDDLRDYLVHYLAQNYWDIMLAEAAKLAEVMRANEDLSKAVFILLSGVGPLKSTDAKIEEKEVKDESKEDVRGEVSPVVATPVSSQTLGDESQEIASGLEAKADSKLKGETGLKSNQPAVQELVLTEEEEKWMRADDELATKD